VLLAEYFAVPMGFTETHHEIPAVDRWMNSLPKPFVIAEVPARSEQDQVDYMNHSTAHWQKTVQGYDGWRRDFHAELYEMMQRFPDEASLEQLEQVGVTYVVVHQERYEPQEWAKVEAALDHYAPRLRLVHVEGSGRVYAVVRSVVKHPAD
jgi:phage baseplate assembly protein W